MTDFITKQKALRQSYVAKISYEIYANEFLQKELEKKYEELGFDVDGKQYQADKTLMGGDKIRFILHYIFIYSCLDLNDNKVERFVKIATPLDGKREKEKPGSHEQRIRERTHFAHYHMRQQLPAELPLAMFKDYAHSAHKPEGCSDTKGSVSKGTIDNILNLLKRLELIKCIASPQGNGSLAFVASDELLSLIMERSNIMEGRKDV